MVSEIAMLVGNSMRMPLRWAALTGFSPGQSTFHAEKELMHMNTSTGWRSRKSDEATGADFC
jgi:hypothetical protein